MTRSIFAGCPKILFGAPPSLIFLRNLRSLPVPQVAHRPLIPSRDSSIRTTHKSDRNTRCRPVAEGEGTWKSSPSKPPPTSSVSSAADGGQVDVPPGAVVFSEDTHEGLALEHQPLHVDVDHLIPLPLSQIDKGHVAVDAGVVDERVDLPELLLGELDQLFAVGDGGGVSAEGSRATNVPNSAKPWPSWPPSVCR